MNTNNTSSPSSDSESDGPQPAFQWWILVAGLILIPANVYWVIRMEALPDLAHPTCLSIFFNAIFSLLVLVALNHLLRLLSPRFAMRQAQLLLLYSMVSIGSAMGGCDMIQKLVPVMSWSFWMADPANKWDEMLNPDVPRFATVSDPNVLKGFYEGGVSPYQVGVLSAWAGPIAAWTLFVVALFVVMICLNVLVRRRWLDDEHLACPLVYLPVEITSPRGTLFRRKPFWVGFAAAGAVRIWNRLAFHYPVIPALQITGLGAGNMAAGLTSPPWNAIRTLPRSFHPFVIGLGYLMPTDFLFSLWFFYFFWKAQLVAGTALGIGQIRDFPFDNFQGFGAYAMFGLYTLWLQRDYLRELYDTLIGIPTRLAREEEARSYQLAAIGVIAGLAVLVWFSMAIGMHLSVSIGFFAIYYVLSVAITRMRAQFGVPVHSVHSTGASNVLPAVLGTRSLAKKDLIGTGMYFWFNRAYRPHPMPFHMEGLKMQQDSAGTIKGTTLALVTAGIVGILAAFWTHLHLCYTLGATTKGGLNMWGGQRTYALISSWLTAPEGPRTGPIVAIVIGAVFAWFLYAMHLRLVNWPFHPLAYAISANTRGQIMNEIWMPLFIAWLIKSAIIKYAGHRIYQLCVPLFLGLILGEFTIGSILNLGSFALGLRRRFVYFVP